VCHPSYAGSINRRIVVQTSLGIMQDPIQKTKAKRARGVAQVFECLPSKHEALSSIPCTTKKERKENSFILILT
jgi:hypothetical protein